MIFRFRIAAILSVPVVVLTVGDSLFPQTLRVYLHLQVSNWLQFLLTTPVVLLAGYPLLERGWQSIRNRHPNMFTLISLGVMAAYPIMGLLISPIWASVAMSLSSVSVIGNSLRLRAVKL